MVDVSHPQAEQQVSSVNRTLEELGLAHKPMLYVLNKVDLLEDRGALRRWSWRVERAVAVSARTGEGMEGLVRAIEEVAQQALEPLRLRLPLHRSDLLGRLHQDAVVVRERYEQSEAILEVRVPPALRPVVSPYVV